MRIIAIVENELGYHENQFQQSISEIPAGWALIPEEMTYPDTFPFVRLTTEGQHVTAMEPGTVPEPVPSPPPEDPEGDILEAVLDHEVRLIQLELGVPAAE